MIQTVAGPRTPSSVEGKTLEKWYLDVLTPDGTVLTAWLGRMRLLGPPITMVSVVLFEPDGSSYSSGSALGGLDHTSGVVRVGPATLDRSRFSVTLRDLRCELEIGAGFRRLEPMGPPVPGLRWIIETPAAPVTGEVLVGGRVVRLEGHLYVDRVVFDGSLRHIGLHRLEWGHFAGESSTGGWMSAITRTGTVRTAWRDGMVRLDLGEPKIEEGRSLFHGRVTSAPGLRFGPLAAPLAWAARAPWQERRAGLVQSGGEMLPAIYEVVTWR